MHARRLIRAVASASLALSVSLVGSTARAQQPTSGVGTVVSASPMYLTPDSARTPLTTLQPGTRVRVITLEGNWYRVIFSDPYLGERTGYVQAAAIRVEASPPPAPPRPGAVPGQANERPVQPVIVAATPMIAHRDNGYVSVNGTFQGNSTAFSATSAYPQLGEIVRIATNYGGVHPAVADVAAGGRVWAGLYVALGVTWAGQITDAALAASVPHPIIANSPRTVTGTVNELHRRELGIHLDAAWSVATPRIQVLVFAGPSWLRVKQPLVTAVTVSEAPPFNTASFVSATVVESTKTHLGGNVGFDASVRVWKALGIGGIVRYSEAKIPFSPAAGTTVTIKAGGLQYGGGIRFRF